MSFSRKKPRKKPIVFLATRGSVSVCGERFNGSCRAKKTSSHTWDYMNLLGSPDFLNGRKPTVSKSAVRGATDFERIDSKLEHKALFVGSERTRIDAS